MLIVNSKLWNISYKKKEKKIIIDKLLSKLKEYIILIKHFQKTWLVL